MFETLANKHITITLMRISYINYISKNTNITYLEREDIARQNGS